MAKRVIPPRAPLPLPRRGLPDKGKPDGTHNQALYFPPHYSTQNQSLPSAWGVVKGKKSKNFMPQDVERKSMGVLYRLWELMGFSDPRQL